MDGFPTIFVRFRMPFAMFFSGCVRVSLFAPSLARASFRIFSGEFNFLPVFATRGRFGIHSDFKFESVSDSDIRTDFTQFENIKQSVENVDAASFRRDFNFLGIVAE